MVVRAVFNRHPESLLPAAAMSQLSKTLAEAACATLVRRLHLVIGPGMVWNS
jgi:hypothetical protein